MHFELLVISFQEKKVHIAYKLTHWSECLPLLLTLCIQPQPRPCPHPWPPIPRPQRPCMCRWPQSTFQAQTCPWAPQEDGTALYQRPWHTHVCTCTHAGMSLSRAEWRLTVNTAWADLDGALPSATLERDRCCRFHSGAEHENRASEQQ